MRRFKLLLAWSKKYTFQMIFMCTMTVICQIIFSYIPVLLQLAIKKLSDGDIYSVNLPRAFIDFLTYNDKLISTILMISIMVVIFELVRSIFLFIESYFKGYITQNVTRDMRLKLYEHLGTLSYTYFNSINAGDVLQRCTSDIETSASFLSERVPELLYLLTCLIVGSIQIGMISTTIMIICFIFIPIIIISSTVFFFYSSRKYEDVEVAEAKMTSVISENINNIRVVKAFYNEKLELEKFDKANKEYSKRLVEHGRLTGNYWGFLNIIMYAEYAFIILFFVYLSQMNLVDNADLIACILIVGMVIWPMQNLGRVIGEMGKTLVAVDRMDNLLNEKDEFSENGSLTPEIKGSIEFKNVGYTFNDGKELFHDVSFKINPGETVAIVGQTGSGKTTIVNILDRLVEYTNGSVLIDGIELKDIEKKHLRRNIGMVLQDSFLYSKTIYENISIAKKDAKKEDVYKAAEMSTISKDIEDFDNGYDTLIGERGSTVSGGQRQRIAISRILLDNRKIVVFDDSLSAVDNKTDLLIRNSLKNTSSTTLIITHRTTTAKEADKIIVLNNNTVEAIGTHDELIKKEGLYKKLWDIQGSAEEDFLRLVKAGEFDE